MKYDGPKSLMFGELLMVELISQKPCILSEKGVFNKDIINSSSYFDSVGLYNNVPALSDDRYKPSSVLALIESVDQY